MNIRVPDAQIGGQSPDQISDTNHGIFGNLLLCTFDTRPIRVTLLECLGPK